MKIRNLVLTGAASAVLLSMPAFGHPHENGEDRLAGVDERKKVKIFRFGKEGEKSVQIMIDDYNRDSEGLECPDSVEVLKDLDVLANLDRMEGLQALKALRMVEKSSGEDNFKVRVHKNGEGQGRHLELGDDMEVFIGDDGKVEVFKNGKALEPGQTSGSNVSVEKKVRVENGKRRIQIVIEMDESE